MCGDLPGHQGRRAFLAEKQSVTRALGLTQRGCKAGEQGDHGMWREVRLERKAEAREDLGGPVHPVEEPCLSPAGQEDIRAAGGIAGPFRWLGRIIWAAVRSKEGRPITKGEMVNEQGRAVRTCFLRLDRLPGPCWHRGRKDGGELAARVPCHLPRYLPAPCLVTEGGMSRSSQRPQRMASPW